MSDYCFKKLFYKFLKNTYSTAHTADIHIYEIAMMHKIL